MMNLYLKKWVIKKPLITERLFLNIVSRPEISCHTNNENMGKLLLSRKKRSQRDLALG